MLPWESKYIIGIFNSFHELKLLNFIMWSHHLSYFDERNTRSLGVIWLKILIKFATQTIKIFQGFKKNRKKMGFGDVFMCAAFCLNLPLQGWVTHFCETIPLFFKPILFKYFIRKNISLNCQLEVGSRFKVLDHEKILLWLFFSFKVCIHFS
jgi:hypothetical protein